jgi:preprotein translocase subunit SecE
MTTEPLFSTKRAVRRFKYIGEIISELKKVVWLTRREVLYLTLLVVIITVAAAVLLGVIDFGFSSLIDKLVVGG